MTMTIHGRVRGKTIELDEAPGVPEGQEVEVQMTIIPPSDPGPPRMDKGLGGLARIYAVLGERYDSGHTDTAERHNEHQP
jgi:hypothetical protein